MTISTEKPGSGPYMMDEAGTAYYGALDPEPEVVVEATGPIKAAVRITGRHLSEDGRKLGKRLRSDPLSRAAREETLRLALEFLGQQPPAGLPLSDLWRWALAHWRLDRVPRRERIEMPPVDAARGQG